MDLNKVGGIAAATLPGLSLGNLSLWIGAAITGVLIAKDTNNRFVKIAAILGASIVSMESYRSLTEITDKLPSLNGILPNTATNVDLLMILTGAGATALALRPWNIYKYSFVMTVVVAVALVSFEIVKI